jgi:hypothetical protein
MSVEHGKKKIKRDKDEDPDSEDEVGKDVNPSPTSKWNDDAQVKHNPTKHHHQQSPSSKRAPKKQVKYTDAAGIERPMRCSDDINELIVIDEVDV